MIRLAPVLATAIAALGLATTAQAATRFVASSGGSDGSDCTSTPCATIAHAVSAAGAGDTISIGPGTYPGAIAPGSKALTFVGAGSGVGGTTIDGSGAMAPALTLAAATTVQGLRLESGLDDNGDSVSAVVAGAASGTPVVHLTGDAIVQATPVGNGMFPPSGDPAVQLGSTAPAASASLQMDTTTIDSGGDSVSIEGARGSVTITSSTLTVEPSAAGTVAISTDTRPVTATASTIGDGVLTGGGDLTLTRDIIHATSTAVTVEGDTANSDVVVRDSVLGPGASGVMPYGVWAVGTMASAISLIGDTILARADSSMLGFPEAAVFINTPVASGTSFSIHNTIMRAIDLNSTDKSEDIEALGKVSWTIQTSSYTHVSGSTVPAPGSSTNIDALPHFTDEPTDLTLGPNSTLFDMGDPTQVTAGETDVAGAPRAADHDCDGIAQPDLGAYEAASPCVPPPAPTPPPTPIPILSPINPPPADHTKPVVSKLSLDDSHFAVAAAAKHKSTVHKGTKLRFTLSETATVSAKVELAHRHTHHRPTTYTTVGTIAYRSQKRGANAHAFTGVVAGRKLQIGSYRLLLTATDAAGNRSSSHTLSFAIVSAR